ncbi:MAG: hypothetical protein ACYDA6_04190 [Solirubrobacteraceae bacterium]
MFAAICEDEFDLRIAEVRQRYPDCIARRVSPSGRLGREVRIEFEYRSSRFNHDPRGCDWLVCWTHDLSPDELRRGGMDRLRVEELRRFFQLVNVWVWPYAAPQADDLPTRTGGRAGGYTVPSQACAGDVLLAYRTERGHADRAAVTHVMEIGTNAEYDRRHKWGTGYVADLRTVLKLPHPVPRSRIAGAAALAPGSYFKRPSPLGRSVLDDWPLIRRCLVAANPGTGVGRALDRLGA